MPYEEEKPPYIRDAEWEMARAFANLWFWSSHVECGIPPTSTTYYVYQKHLSLDGHSKEKRRIKITIEMDAEQQV